MQFDIVTLFPNYFASPLKESLIAKALENKKFAVNIVDLRQYSNLAHSQVDDTPYGGGAGMVLRADVLASCIKALKSATSKVILLDPAGEVFSQEKAETLLEEEHIILVCGRYEGVDQRFKDKYVDRVISIGDYVLNGGEVASLVVLESIVRLMPGVIGNSESLKNESFSKTSSREGREVRLLDYPHYTRPDIFEGEQVPAVLLSGDHKKIAQWRTEQAEKLTQKLRPDLLT